MAKDLSDGDFKKAVDDFWNARQGGAFPDWWAGKLGFEWGIRINIALIERHVDNGQQQAGWKVGLTAPAIRKQAGATEPTFAVLYDHGRWPSGQSHPINDLINPGIENELCLTMGQTLTGPNVTIDDAAKAIKTIGPSFELIENRLPNGLRDRALSAADNGQQRAFIVGEESDAVIGHDLATSSVDVWINNKHQEQAFGSEVMEIGPLASIAWLANRLARYNLSLEAGSAVMSGSFTKQYTIREPARIEAKFEPFGDVVVNLT